MRAASPYNKKHGRPIKLIYLLFLCLALSGCSATSNAPIKIGIVDDHAPWEKRISDTEAEGISIDLIKAFASYTGQNYKLVWLDQDDLFTALSDKRVDCILSALSFADANRETFLISDPYTKSYPILLIRKDSIINNKAQLNRETTQIAVIVNTQNEAFVKSEYSNAVIQTYSTRTEAMNALNSSSCDVFVDDPLSVFALHSQNPEITRINPAPLTDKFQYYTVYVTPTMEGLVDKWNDFFTYARKNKLFDSLNEKHIAPFKPLMDQHNITITL